MLFQRDPSAPRLAPLSLALLLGLGSAPPPAWSLDLGDLVGQAPGAVLTRVMATLGLAIESSSATAPEGAGVENAEAGDGGEDDAGVIIDPNGKPKP